MFSIYMESVESCADQLVRRGAVTITLK